LTASGFYLQCSEIRPLDGNADGKPWLGKGARRELHEALEFDVELYYDLIGAPRETEARSGVVLMPPGSSPRSTGKM